MRQGYLDYINKLTSILNQDTTTSKDLREHNSDMEAHKTSLQANATPDNKRVNNSTTPPSETERRIWKNAASTGIWGFLEGHMMVRPQNNYLYDITNGKWYNNDAEEIPNPGITLGAVGPVAYSLTSDVQEVNTGDDITFTCVASDVDGIVVKYEWDFGNGVVEQTTEDTVVRSFSLPGSFTPKVRVQDNSGLWSSWVSHNTSGITVIEVEGVGGWFGDRGLYAGGDYIATIDYFNTTGSSGNGTFFGNLTAGRRNQGAVSNNVRGVFSHGYETTASNPDFITIATQGNAIVFGSTTNSYIAGPGAVSDGIYGLWAGGLNSGSGLPIERFTIAAGGSSSSFGNLSVSRSGIGSASNGIKGIFAGGRDTSLKVIDYVNIATPSNAMWFGELTVGRSLLAGTENTVKAVFCGGSTTSGVTTTNPLNTMDYIVMDTTGNALTFGSLATASMYNNGTSNGTKGFIAGGNTSSYQQILTIDIASGNTATSFGNLSYGGYCYWGGMCSGSPT